MKVDYESTKSTNNTRESTTHTGWYRLTVGLLRKRRLLEAIHGRVVLGARPEDLQADATLVELTLLGAHRFGHLPAQFPRAQRAPLGAVADSAARSARLHRLADPKHLEELGELRVCIGGEQPVAGAWQALLVLPFRGGVARRRHEQPALDSTSPLQAVVGQLPLFGLAAAAQHLTDHCRVYPDHPQLACQHRERTVEREPRRRRRRRRQRRRHAVAGRPRPGVVRWRRWGGHFRRHQARRRRRTRRRIRIRCGGVSEGGAVALAVGRDCSEVALAVG
eukprot:scaffold22777_cov67-Phaeocystis_antarctica.AAC.5